MTRFERWTLSLSALSTMVTIAGIVFVGLQLRGANDSLRTGVYSNMSNWTFELDKAFLDHPELRPYFYDGKDIQQSDPLYFRAETMAEFILDNFDSIMKFDRTYPETLHEGWRNWIYDSFSRSPLLVRTMEKLKPEYEPGPAWPIYADWKRRHSSQSPPKRVTPLN